MRQTQSTGARCHFPWCENRVSRQGQVCPECRTAMKGFLDLDAGQRRALQKELLTEHEPGKCILCEVESDSLIETLHGHICKRCNDITLEAVRKAKKAEKIRNNLHFETQPTRKKRRLP